MSRALFDGKSGVGGRWRPVVAAIVVGLVAAGCGGDGTGGDLAVGRAVSSTVTPAPAEALVPFAVDEVDPGSRAAMAALVEAHGQAGGFVALVSALERGYTVDQIVTAATSGDLDERGSIVIDGTPMAPPGPRAGVLELAGDGEAPTSLAPGAVWGVAASHQPDGFEEDLQAVGLLPMLEEADQEHDVVPAEEVERSGAGTAYGLAILELARTGYPLEVIVAAILEGRRAQWVAGCAVIEDPETGFLVPRPIPDTPCWEKFCEVFGPIFCPPEQPDTGQPLPETSEDPPPPESGSPDPAPDDTVVIVEGELTGGPIISGANTTVEAVTENELEFVLSFADGVVTGEGIVDRRIDGSNEDCRDRYTSPLGFTFEGTLVPEDGSASGTFEWQVVEARFEQLELEELGTAACSGRTSFASGTGEWEATWRPEERTFEGSLTIPGGLGTNTFELEATTVITSE